MPPPPSVVAPSPHRFVSTPGPLRPRHAPSSLRAHHHPAVFSSQFAPTPRFSAPRAQRTEEIERQASPSPLARRYRPGAAEDIDDEVSDDDDDDDDDELLLLDPLEAPRSIPNLLPPCKRPRLNPSSPLPSTTRPRPAHDPIIISSSPDPSSPSASDDDEDADANALVHAHGPVPAAKSTRPPLPAAASAPRFRFPLSAAPPPPDQRPPASRPPQFRLPTPPPPSGTPPPSLLSPDRPRYHHRRGGGQRYAPNSLAATVRDWILAAAGDGHGSYHRGEEKEGEEMVRVENSRGGCGMVLVRGGDGRGWVLLAAEAVRRREGPGKGERVRVGRPWWGIELGAGTGGWAVGPVWRKGEEEA